MTQDTLRFNSIQSVQSALTDGSISLVEIVTQFLSKIEANKHLNAFLEVYTEEALQRAKELEKKAKKGKLYGVVVGLKDNLCHKGHTVTASSKILESFISPYNATVVERLLAQDAIIIGRLNCDEFAMGSSNETSAYGPVLNPLDTSRVPGGSSGGSVAAVSAGLCLASLGSDTGGSIRQPASFCGVVGFKPSYGRVSRYGLLAYASSFDQIGTFTHTIEDAALITEIIAGKDPLDSTCSQRATPTYSQLLGKSSSRKIAVLKDTIEKKGIESEVKETILQFIEILRNDGHTIDLIDFPEIDYTIPAYQVLSTAEASSNLARYDGVHYGYRSPNATDLESTYKKSRTEGFGKEVKRRIMSGTFVLSAGYYDAYYSKAQKVRRVLRDKTKAILKNYDFILTPTSPTVAFPFGAKSDPITMYLSDIFTALANHTGMPAISLPLFQDKKGLPFGLQLMNDNFEEHQLFAFSQQLMNRYKNA